MPFLTTNLRNNKLSISYLIIAILLTLFILTQVSMEKEIPSVGVLLFKLTPFIFATLSISTLSLREDTQRILSLTLIPVVFLGFFCYFVPKLFFFSNEFDVMYQTMLMAVPYIILILTLAYRLGGGSSGATIRVSFAMLLLMLSGIEDLAFLLLSSRYDPNWAGMPEVWEWASHMSVFIGRPLTQYEAYVFIAIHILLVLIVLFYPFKRSSLGKSLALFQNPSENRNAV